MRQDLIARPPETTMDRTLILDPAELWPDPLSCPDWPIETATRRYEGQRGRAGAEAHLERLGAILNRGGKLHVPSAEERAEAFAQIFARHGSDFYRYGITGLSALNRTVEEQARVAVDAAHVRGYLRKLDLQEAEAAEAEQRRLVDEARHQFDNFNASVAAGRAELTDLAEAEARHKQREADERAAARCVEIRRNLRHSHYPAVQAAGVLGVEAPAMPTFID